LFKTLKPILILIIWASPLIFLDLYSKHWAHQNITDESKEIVITEKIVLEKPVLNHWFLLNSDLDVPEYKRLFRNGVFFLLAFLCLWGQWQGSYWFDRLPWICIRGGILANTFDACFLGGAKDFIAISFADKYVIANLADFFIVGGFLFLPLIWCSIFLYNYLNNLKSRLRKTR